MFRKSTRFISIIIIMAMLSTSVFAYSLQASTDVSVKASSVFTGYGVSVYAGDNGVITFTCTALGTDTMDTIGFSEMQIQKYYNGSWITVVTLYDEYQYDTDVFLSSIDYYGTAGYKYRAIVTFYAANSTSSATRTYTSISIYAE